MADWMRLDNAALIFPAVRRRSWTNAFRVSATLNEPVNPEILQRAVDALAPRFPSMYVSLHRGAFWYYLQKLPQGPRVGQDGACPLIHMTGRVRGAAGAWCDRCDLAASLQRGFSG